MLLKSLAIRHSIAEATLAKERPRLISQLLHLQ